MNNRNLSMVLALLLTAAPAMAEVWYVDNGNVSGTEDGLSWATAFTTIQEGIDAASASDEVHVAQGTYGEARVSPAPYNINFNSGSVVMKPGVDLLGGFSGNGTERDPDTFPTVIDGRTSRGGGYATQVVIGADDADLDGFTLRGARGYYTIVDYTREGMGVYSSAGAGDIRNCAFEDMQASSGSYLNRIPSLVRTIGGTQRLEACEVAHASTNEDVFVFATQSAITITDTAIEGVSFAVIGEKSDVTIEDSLVGGQIAYMFPNSDTTLTLRRSEVQANIRVGNVDVTIEDCDIMGGDHFLQWAQVVATDSTLSDASIQLMNAGFKIYTSNIEQTSAINAFDGAVVAVDAHFVDSSVTSTNGSLLGIDSSFSGSTASGKWLALDDCDVTGGGVIGGTGSATLMDCVFTNSSLDTESTPASILGCTIIGTGIGIGGGNAYLQHCGIQGGSTEITAGSAVFEDCTLQGSPVSSANADALFVDCALDSSDMTVDAGNLTVGDSELTRATAHAIDNVGAALRIYRTRIAECFGLTQGVAVSHMGAADLIVEDCVFENNFGTPSGALDVQDSGHVELRDTQFLRNASNSTGGGVTLTSVSDVLVTNCSFGSNSSQHEGGALKMGNSNALIHNSVFWGNSAGAGAGAIAAFGTGYELTNSVSWRNGSEPIQNDGPPTAVNVSYCDIQGGYPGTGNFSQDPLFLNPAAGDFRIRSSSPLVDTGTTVADPVLDIRDLARPQGTDYDIGIYEFLDTDGDGMEDPWETLYGLNPNDPSDAAGDLDSDGFTNLEEFELDTDPTTPTVVPATYYVSLEGDDETGDGTAENPWRTIAFAMNEAGLVAPYIGGATVHLAAGVYEEPVALMPHVTLMGDAATTTTIRYFNAADDDHVVIRGADESALKQVKVTLPSLHADVTVLVRIDDVATEIGDCILDGGDNLFSIGVLVSGVGSSDSTIHDNTIRRVQYGIQAVNSAVNITENVFEAIRGDAVFVELPAKKQAGEALTPLLGDAENDDSGFNEFKNVAGRFVLNLSENKTTAEYNDWGVYSAAQIAAKVSGDVDFMPFLGRDGTIPVGPGAAFTATPVEGVAPLVVELDDASDAGSFDITSWSWDFGDPESGANNESAEQNPTHTYTQPGRYTVALTVETGAGSDTLTQVDLVEVTAAEGPQANFSVAPGQGYAPLLVQFNDTSTAGTATVTGWDWDFGDPLSGAANTSAEQNPSHTYANTGIYYVKLTIETSLGEDTAFRSAVVVEAPEAPVASFTANPLTGSAPLEVQFTDASDLGTGTGTTWEWNFDDPDSGEANVSTEQNPVHTFAAPGLYTVTLTVTTEHGTDEHTELAYIDVTRRGCGADGKLEFASAGVFLLVFERVTRRRRYHA